MNSVFILIKKHWGALLIAAIIGLILAGPNLFFIQTPEYKGIPLMYTDSEDYYLARMHAAYSGCIMGCNPFTEAEFKHLPFYDPSISTAILALPGIIFNIPVTDLKIIYEFLLPFILSLLIYSLIFRLIKNKLLSLSGTLLIVLGFNLLNINDFLYLPNIIAAISLQPIEYWEVLFYARIVNPTFSSIIFFTYLHILLYTLQKPSRKMYVVLTLLYGLSFYIYFFTYMFLTAIQFACIALFLYKKESKNALRIFLSTLVGLILGSPVIIEMIRLVNHPLQQSLVSYGIENTHMPTISIFGVALAITYSVLFLLYKKIFKEIPLQIWFLTVLVISGFLANNQHVITGRIVQYFHFNLYYITPIFIILICFVLSLLITRPILNRLLFILVLIVTILNGVMIQCQIYKKDYNRILSFQEYVPVLKFLDGNIPQKSVVIAPTLETLIPIYTNLYQVWTRNSEFYYLHTEEREIDGLNSLLSSAFFEKAVKRYSAEYLILTKEDAARIYFNLKPYTEDVLYKDGKVTVFKLR